MKTFKIKNRQKTSTSATQSEIARFELVLHMPWQQNSAKAKATTLRPKLALEIG